MIPSNATISNPAAALIHILKGGGKDACCEKTLLIAGACQFLAGDVDGCVGSVGMSSDELFKVTTEALEALIAEGSVIADENKDSNLVSLLPSSLQ